MRIGSIDIGTNTILLLIAETDDNKITNVIHDEQVIARLGKGVDEHGVINQETFHRVAQCLNIYRETSHALHVEKIIAVGTSALRDASNRSEFCDSILRETGINIEILSGDEEAEWTYRGAIGEREEVTENFTVLDIGGGSTEIISGTTTKIIHKISLDIGCVRLTERFLRTSPPTSLEIAEARSFIRQHLKTVDFAHTNLSHVFGVAGTLTTLAAFQLQLPKYNPTRVEGHRLHYDEIRQAFNQLRIKTVEEIKTIPQISQGRADIILAGIFILLEFMEAANLGQIIVSDRGLRYGIVMREIARSKAAH